MYIAEPGAERTLLAVGYTPWLRLSKNPEIEKTGVYNSFVFKRRFSMKTPKSDFFDSLVRRGVSAHSCHWGNMPSCCMKDSMSK